MGSQEVKAKERYDLSATVSYSEASGEGGGVFLFLVLRQYSLIV